MSAVTRSYQDYSIDFKLREDKDGTLTEIFNKAMQLVGENKVDEAIGLLAKELDELGFRTEGLRETCKNVLALSALNRVMEEFQHLRREMERNPAAEPIIDCKPRNEKATLAIDDSMRGRIEAQKEIHRGNVLALKGDKDGARKAYSKAGEHDAKVKEKLDPEAEIRKWSVTHGGATNILPQGQTSQESTQIKE